VKPKDFLATRRVFTRREFVAALDDGKRTGQTRDSLLAYYARTGRVLRVRRGLFASVPAGMEPAQCPVDAFLLAGRMTDDAVLGYHTALAFHGRAHSVSHEFRYLTARHARPLAWRGNRFLPVAFPAALRRAKQEAFGVRTVDRLGLSVRVTTHERTLVDVLDRPDLGGGWEEVWRSLESVEFFDLDQVVTYALLLDNATTAAKVGFFLQTHREALMVPDGPLGRLRERRPAAPHYLDPSAARGRGRLVAEWNLVVPAEILDRAWEEPA